MVARVAEVTLTFLERNGEHWRFSTKLHAEFDRWMVHLSSLTGTHIRTLYPTLGSGQAALGKIYEVPEQTMWVLSHLFCNWEEMRETAERPKQHTFTEREYRGCAFTGCTADGFLMLIQCEDCQRRYCSTHVQRLNGKWICQSCLPQHESQQRRQEQQRNPYEFTWTSWDASHTTFTLDEDIERIRRIFDDAVFGRQRSGTSGTTRQQRPTMVSREVHEAFALLGLEPGASIEQVKQAFKAKALQHHPDLHGPQAHQAMVNLNKAREIALAYAGGKR